VFVSRKIYLLYKLERREDLDEFINKEIDDVLLADNIRNTLSEQEKLNIFLLIAEVKRLNN